MSLFEKWKTNRSPSGAPEFLIVGLGNPGPKYEFTRHNAGFLCMDLLAQQVGVKIDRIKFKSVVADVAIEGRRCILMKPQTFMNNSGEAVRDAANFYKIPPEHIIILFDDISLPPGKLRIRRKGSDGGHNGIKSILYLLGSDQFPRIKLGVGAKPRPDYDLADWVLSTFQKDELSRMKEAMEKACEAVPLLVREETDRAMNLYNS
jgi:PTH1 family peptidyl-tRNA hydrolase